MEMYLLCVSFLTLFAIATSKEALVEDVWTASESEEKDWGGGGGGVGAPCFSKPFND